MADEKYTENQPLKEMMCRIGENVFACKSAACHGTAV